MSDPRSQPEPPESVTEPMPLPAPNDEPLDLEDDREVQEERPRVTSTDDLLGTPRGARSDDPRDPGSPG